MKYDTKAELKSTPMNELMRLRDQFTSYFNGKESLFVIGHPFVSYLHLVKLEIAARTGNKK